MKFFEGDKAMLKKAQLSHKRVIEAAEERERKKQGGGTKEDVRVELWAMTRWCWSNTGIRLQDQWDKWKRNMKTCWCHLFL